MRWKQDEHDLAGIHVRERRERKSDPMVFKKCVSFCANIGSMQWRNLDLLRTLLLLKAKCILCFLFKFIFSG